MAIEYDQPDVVEEGGSKELPDHDARAAKDEGKRTAT
jgi:hypothetical protein